MSCLIVSFSLFLSDKRPLCLAYTLHAGRCTAHQEPRRRSSENTRFSLAAILERPAFVNCQLWRTTTPPPPHAPILPAPPSTVRGICFPILGYLLAWYKQGKNVKQRSVVWESRVDQCNSSDSYVRALFQRRARVFSPQNISLWT